MGWEQDGYALKTQLEVAHPAILTAFIVVSLFGWLGRGMTISGWMALLGSALLAREIHFLGSDYLMFTILIGIFVYAWRNPSRFTELWASPWPLSLLVTCFLYYACSEALFDRALIEKPFNLLLTDPDWELPYISNIEESQETLGGTILLLSSVTFVFRSPTS